MKLSDINPTGVLKQVLTDYGVTQKIYTGDKPTSGLPAEYIELRQNGGLKTNLTKMGLVQGYVLLSINVKLLTTGGRNTVRENIILSTFDGLFKDGAAVSRDGYVFSLDPENIVYSGGGIYEGYSSKLINITFNKA
jgi:hypothetical protein